MNTYNTHFHDKIRNFPEISRNICLLQLQCNARISKGLKNKFESARINGPLVFESLESYITKTSLFKYIETFTTENLF